MEFKIKKRLLIAAGMISVVALLLSFSYQDYLEADKQACKQVTSQQMFERCESFEERENVAAFLFFIIALTALFGVNYAWD